MTVVFPPCIWIVKPLPVFLPKDMAYYFGVKMYINYQPALSRRLVVSLYYPQLNHKDRSHAFYIMYAHCTLHRVKFQCYHLSDRELYRPLTLTTKRPFMKEAGWCAHQ